MQLYIVDWHLNLIKGKELIARVITKYISTTIKHMELIKHWIRRIGTSQLCVSRLRRVDIGFRKRQRRII